MELTEIQKNLILLSLSNLVEEYNNALEDNQINPETREFMISAIQEALLLIETLKPKDDVNTKTISRPKWEEG